MRTIIVVFLVGFFCINTSVATNHESSQGTGTEADKSALQEIDSEKIKNREESPELGRMLYQNHCTGCHESNAHIRINRKAKSVEDLRYWVDRWEANQGLKWQQEQKEAVLRYLRDTYYKF